jgi:outer membrane protein OmpA-like peptidoglycan-associated protein/opacity protein-like surface antigen
MRFATRLIITATLAAAMLPALQAANKAKPDPKSSPTDRAAAMVARTAAKINAIAADRRPIPVPVPLASQPAPAAGATPAAVPAAPPKTGSNAENFQTDGDGPLPLSSSIEIGRPNLVAPIPSPSETKQNSDDPQTTYPKVEWFLGYSFWRAVPTSTNNRIAYLHGGSTSLAYNFNHWLGLAADFAGFNNTRLTLSTPTGSETIDANGSAYTFMAGPRLSYRHYERFTPFAQALFGGAHASPVTAKGCSGDPSCTPLASDTGFAAMFGAGLDIKITRHIAWRAIEADYLLTRFKDPSSTNGQDRAWQNNVRLSSGIVLRFGGNNTPIPPPPPEPMVATCSAVPGYVYFGSNDFIAVHAQVSNPGQYPLNYSWSATEGAVDGTGPDARWNSGDRHLGTYTIKARVDNSRNGTAACEVNVRVEPLPNRQPTISCSANRREVVAGDPVEITATASDPDNDPLTYSWKTTGGTIEGTGWTVKLQTANVAPGQLTISGQVNDGRNGTADCTLYVDVQAPPEIKELETRLALHSIYFPTARPTAANPTGGLVESQEKVLQALAKDFVRYLTFKPEAHLILEAHADRRGPVDYNKQLTDRRVERSKAFLVEHGVPAANIETRSLGKEDNLNEAQVKQLIDQNPDLTPDERQKIDANLKVIVLANNRRVDISLNLTGQQSVRQYPFNARDSLTLLSPKGGEPAKLAKPATNPKSTEP